MTPFWTTRTVRTTRGSQVGAALLLGVVMVIAGALRLFL